MSKLPSPLLPRFTELHDLAKARQGELRVAQHTRESLSQEHTTEVIFTRPTHFRILISATGRTAKVRKWKGDRSLGYAHSHILPTLPQTTCSSRQGKSSQDFGTFRSGLTAV